ncbi:MAG: disulfide bond formation protein DsbB [Rickettsiales bacterium]|jgi:disulfide bond formation protein DsbB
MKKITSQNLLIILLTTSICALIGAYVSQYYFEMQPCQLCFWQRKPFFAIIIISTSFLAMPFLKKYQNIAVKIAILCLLINVGIAFYHSGVERKIFKGLDSCSSISKSPNNIDDLYTMLIKTKAVPCDQSQFTFLHLSMAEWNFLYCLILMIGISIIMQRKTPTRNSQPTNYNS